MWAPSREWDRTAAAMLLTLAPELQLLFVELLVVADLVAAGRLAQVSVACKQLLQHPPLCRCASRRTPLGAASPDGSPARTPACRCSGVLCTFSVRPFLSLFLHCNAHAMAGGTPCGRAIRAARDAHSPRSASSLRKELIAHMQKFHAAEYGALILSLQEM